MSQENIPTGSDRPPAYLVQDGEVRAFIPDRAPETLPAGFRPATLDPGSAAAAGIPDDQAGPGGIDWETTNEEANRKALDAAFRLADWRKERAAELAGVDSPHRADDAVQIVDAKPVIVMVDEASWAFTGGHTAALPSDEMPERTRLAQEAAQFRAAVLAGGPGKTTSTTEVAIPDDTAAVVLPNSATPTLLISMVNRTDKSRPKPYYVLPGGRIGRQDWWQGKPLELAGFQRDPDVEHVDLELEDVYDNLAAATGMYPVVIDAAGDMFTQLDPVESVQVYEGRVHP